MRKKSEGRKFTYCSSCFFFIGELFRMHVHIYICKLVSWIPGPDVQGSAKS